MFSPKRWDELIAQFRQENLSLYQLNLSSVLSVSLQAGLAALKTPSDLNAPLDFPIFGLFVAISFPRGVSSISIETLLVQHYKFQL